MEMPLKNTGKVLALEWDKDGDSVAILQVPAYFAYLTVHSKTTESSSGIQAQRA